MEYSEYYDQAAEYMRLAVPLMRKHGIAMTPANYAIWYEYVSGKNLALQDAVDKKIEDHGQLSEKESRELYERFFDREKAQAAVLEMRQDLKRVLGEVLNYLSASVSNSSERVEHLENILHKMKPDMSQQEVHEIIEEVLSETRLSLSQNELLTDRLNSTVAEIQALKKELESAQREAKTDTLTKLANRKAFDQILEKATRDADTSGLEVCLIFADIDLFKQINDKHGHLVGDQVLKVIATTLKASVKGRDLVARYGGEEFVILLLNTSLENTKKLADNIRADIASKRIQRRDTREPLGKITLSFGVARYFPSEGTESFLQRADRALYMAKRKGRNIVAEAPPPVI